MAVRTHDAALLDTLAPTAERLYERHVKASKEWFPHEMVSYDDAKDYLPGEEWDPSMVPMPDAVRSSLLVNILTEDNLPYYFSAIARMFGEDSIWGTWSHRWTAEEGRHSIVLRDYLTMSRSLDPWVLERARMQQVQAGFAGAAMPDAPNGFVYVALQELATRIAHWNTGEMLDDPRGKEIMRRVAADENFHHLFYRDMVAEAIAVDPNRIVGALLQQVKTFEMPGTGIAGFRSHALAIAEVGIYDLAIHHDKILQWCIVTQWKIDQLEGLDAQAEADRDELFSYMSRLKKVGDRAVEKRLARAEKALASV